MISLLLNNDRRNKAARWPCLPKPVTSVLMRQTLTENTTRKENIMKAPQITRTFTTTRATILGLDTINAEPMNKDIDLAGHFESEDKIIKAAKKLIETEDFKVCKLVRCEEITELRGMSVQKFLENSEVIPDKATADNQ